MLTPRAISFRSLLLAFSLVTASLVTLPTSAYAAPCNAAAGGGLGCAAEGENPGGPGDPGGPGEGNNGDGGNGGNNGPGTGPDDGGDGALTPGAVVPPAAAVPDTEDTIAKAFNQIEFPVPDIETAPEPKTYVRVKTSFWIPADQVQEITVQASVGAAEGVQPQTITATAKLAKVLWDLVEEEKICEGPGRPNGEGDGEECDHYFKTSSAYHGMEAFPIKATPLWYITWTCAGVCPDGGDNPEEPEVLYEEYPSPAGEIDLVVDEIQTEANDN